jgi:hypothetical protein
MRTLRGKWKVEGLDPCAAMLPRSGQGLTRCAALANWKLDVPDNSLSRSNGAVRVIGVAPMGRGSEDSSSGKHATSPWFVSRQGERLVAGE